MKWWKGKFKKFSMQIAVWSHYISHAPSGVFWQPQFQRLASFGTSVPNWVLPAFTHQSRPKFWINKTAWKLMMIAWVLMAGKKPFSRYFLSNMITEPASCLSGVFKAPCTLFLMFTSHLWGSSQLHFRDWGYKLKPQREISRVIWIQIYMAPKPISVLHQAMHLLWQNWLAQLPQRLGNFQTL